MTVYFIDGSDMSISFPEPGGNPLMLARRIQAALDADQVALEVDDELMMIPKSSIKYMTLNPLPDELPESVIRGASVVTPR